VREGVDPEAIHDMRVALRRLQAALRLLKACYPPKRLRRYRRQLRTLLQTLGAVRDQDIIIGDLALHAEASADPVKEALARVMAQRRTVQQQERAKSLRLLDKLQEGNFSQNLLSFVRGARGFKRAPSQGRFGPEIASIATKALSSWNGRRRELQAQDDPETLHQMRIAIKRLRYTLELCCLANGQQYRECVERLTEMQRVLGDLHDADMVVQCLAESLPHASVEAIVGLADIMRVTKHKRQDLARRYHKMIGVRNLGPLRVAPGGTASAGRSQVRPRKQAAVSA
ncbi:MAG: CHAD domain-containing protein, partial [Candidatus Methylomirabilis sp.]